MVELFKALSDENRLRIVNLLMYEELCVCEIEVLLQISQSNTSRHLNKLKNSGIISSSKNLQWVHYKVSDAFKNEHHTLFKYLSENFKLNELLQKDVERYHNYKKFNLNCQYITEDRENVLNLIK